MHNTKSILRYRSNYIYVSNFIIFTFYFFLFLFLNKGHGDKPMSLVGYGSYIISPLVSVICAIKFLSNLSDWFDVKRKIHKLNHRIKNHKLDARFYFTRGNYFYKIADFDSAIDDYIEAILLKKDFAHAYNNRGNAYNMTDSWTGTKDALRDWDKAKSLGLKTNKKKLLSLPTSDEFSSELEKLWH